MANKIHTTTKPNLKSPISYFLLHIFNNKELVKLFE